LTPLSIRSKSSFRVPDNMDKTESDVFQLVSGHISDQPNFSDI